ncbi:hypothetical protein JCM17961_15230 [Endothiovibrio diazotrophicus]
MRTGGCCGGIPQDEFAGRVSGHVRRSPPALAGMQPSFGKARTARPIGRAAPAVRNGATARIVYRSRWISGTKATGRIDRAV